MYQWSVLLYASLILNVTTTVYVHVCPDLHVHMYMYMYLSLLNHLASRVVLVLEGGYDVHVWFIIIDLSLGLFAYTRYGQEDKLVNLFGIMQALISFVQDDKDVLRYTVCTCTCVSPPPSARKKEVYMYMYS